MEEQSVRGTGRHHGLERAAVDLTAQLVAMNTVNPSLVPGAPGENAAVTLLADRLAGAGFEVEVIRSAASRPSLLARHRGTGNGRSLLLNGHLDTVGVGAMVEPFSARIEGDELTGTMHGRGTSDMKSGVAAMVVCAESAAAAGTSGDLLLALVADEEHASVGTDAVIAHLQSRGALPRACIVGEPTWLELSMAHRGYALVEVELKGRAAHSSQPGEGSNAVTHLGRLLSAVERYNDELAARPAHPYAGHGSLIATVASGGEAPFTLAARAGVTIERRTVPGELARDALAQVDGLLAQLHSVDPEVTGHSTLGLFREAWQARPGDPTTTELLDLFTAGLAAAGRPDTPRTGAPYWMESALWDAAGVPTVVCGPAGGGMHADNEWVELAQIRAYATALHHVISSFTC